MPRVIVLPVDGSPTALQATRHVVERLAGQSVEFELHVLNVQYRIPLRAAAAVGREVVREYYRSEEAVAVAEARKILDASNVAYRSVRKIGHPASEIAGYAELEKADLIVMGSHGLGAAKGLLLGSVVQGVLAGCRVPVLVIREGSDHANAGETLVAVDGSAYSLRAITYLLRRRALFCPDAKITLLHAAPLERVFPFGDRTSAGREAVDAEHERALRPARRLLARANVQWNEVLVEGDPATEIAAYVQRHAPGMIVMGSHGRGAVAGLLLGSVAQKTLSSCRTPVLIVR
jgi:nucleotide-binding universal stress UspA family protein